MNKKLRPVIKWTGGKYDEFASFAHHIPPFERYIEPFFGGGGVFFALQPNVPSLINDKSEDLINFYGQLGKIAFEKEMMRYANAWDELSNLAVALWQDCANQFVDFIQNHTAIDKLKECISQKFQLTIDQHALLNNEDFMINLDLFKSMLLASIANKASRIKSISIKENRIFSIKELYNHFETGIKSGAYLFFRKLLNQHYTKAIILNEAKAAANWYFVREFCYGAMFRFNAKGEFNIPYGGIAYNRKNFRTKAINAVSDQINNLFKQTSISNLDFEAFLNRIKLKSTDFIFIDPPYDSEFSEYDQSAFTQKDQQRLAAFLINTNAKWMMVIKETVFIRELYTHPTLKILTFDKNYAYNVRGRNNRAVTHLIIKNY